MASLWKKGGVYLDLVYTFPATILAGAGAGWLLDRWLGWKPYGTLGGFFIGVAGAFWYLFRMLGVTGGRKGPRADR